VGTTYSTQRTFTKEDVTAFAALTGDPNPIHVDGRAASRAGFEAPVVHGMLCANLFGAVIGTLFPGAVYATQSLAFRNPVLVGQAVTAEVTLTRLTGTRAQFDTRVVFRKGEGEGDAADAKTVTAVDGVALALLPKR
jgi:3-hydroxybutyryl-CoA dehydratase